MLKFTSSADLCRLHHTDPAHPVITKLADGLFSETMDTHNGVIALMESHDVDHPLTQLGKADDVTLEGIIEQQGTYLIALDTDYGYGIVLVVPQADWLSSELHQCIEDNLYH